LDENQGKSSFLNSFSL
jgi:hypothetical protein